jgi:hypothetical protein
MTRTHGTNGAHRLRKHAKLTQTHLQGGITLNKQWVRSPPLSILWTINPTGYAQINLEVDL